MKKMKKKRRANKTFVKTEDDKRRQKTGRKIKCGKKWERKADGAVCGSASETYTNSAFKLT